MQNLNITTQDQARQFAIDWQSDKANKSMSYSELSEAQSFFTDLAERFDLIEEFTENGII